ncbi:PrsW family glutamic-type intramembrane protease [Blastopirellula sp. JC732]|uniref:PrsW family glutamic-type intramembrane protease n=1 Tax=Blastopirellula sediminis TaxID=2894196 RepID=A0A9X1MK29_9BACT|nr:PrsW family glutamic-type intramembrane protease [Blastopirellula sediminis]MCC9608615.1 PrsW family glutamic-type intramembrane protease [Blastopirellula sediminis]MCC9628608.1 PrsW family glutamic-type intramembrane protease [Blastopirellula sediminis]
MPVSAGWKLRVTTGTSAGKEYDLSPGSYLLGSGPMATIRIPDASIAERHVELDVQPTQVVVSDRSGRTGGVLVNGKPEVWYQAGPGDEVAIGIFRFQLVNAGLAAAKPAAANDWLDNQVDSASQRLKKLQPHWQVALVSGSLATLLLILLAATSNPIIAPITVLAASLVAPATIMTYLVEKYDKTGISLRTLALTFLFGGAIGFAVTIIAGSLAGAFLGGLLLIPVFAGVLEEPAKLIATAWRWRHPVYDRPMDGLILGAMSGFGFAVFETAGYFLTIMMLEGVGQGIMVVIIRSISAPFTHGVWSAIVCAAFWQSGRKLKTAIFDRRFQIAMGTAVGLHAMWNLGASVGAIGILFCLGSATLSWRAFRSRLKNNGYMT